MDPNSDHLHAACGADVASGNGGARTLPEIEESVHVDRVQVDRGGYKIAKVVSATDVQVDTALHEDRVDIERRAIGRQLEDGETPQSRYEGDTLIVPVIEEVVVTVKRMVLVEEVRITRVTSTREHSEQVTLRKEHIEIERLGADTQVIRSSSPPSDRQP